ncbi:hypothetical protein BDM02DRAFT_3108025 [Thelephora ganbajun]|uniref:Uncharacterized protein n=1 Tax=Thelephora ganbajun TaxID=370292 RepID=A0ACB6ZUX2_THEGA|nr:hypothetical protein BDM02DRAFT_3108025 [Thelephora ganbajun]
MSLGSLLWASAVRRTLTLTSIPSPTGPYSAPRSILKNPQSSVCFNLAQNHSNSQKGICPSALTQETIYLPPGS